MTISLTARKQETPVTQSIIENRFSDFTRLIERGADVEQPNSLGFTPIQLARYLGRKRFLEELYPSPSPWLLVQRRKKSRSELCTPDAFKELFDAEYLPHLRFDSVRTLYLVKKFVDRNIRRWYDLSDLRSNLFISLANRLSDGEIAPVEIRWIDEQVGYGLFAGTDFEADELICEYTGIVSPTSFFGRSTSCYVLSYLHSYFPPKRIVVDAKNGGNVSRFINHSSHPNVCLCAAIDHVIVHPVVLAARPICRGEQLFLNYGSQFSF